MKPSRKQNKKINVKQESCFGKQRQRNTKKINLFNSRKDDFVCIENDFNPCSNRVALCTHDTHKKIYQMLLNTLIKNVKKSNEVI